MYGIHQSCYLIRVDIGMDTVPQIEDVTIGWPVCCQYLCYLPAYRCG